MHLAVPVVEFSKERYKIRKLFVQKSTYPKENYGLLRIGAVASCRKLGNILENNVI